MPARPPPFTSARPDLGRIVDAIEERATPTVVIAALRFNLVPMAAWRLEAKGFEFFNAGIHRDELVQALYEAGYDEITVIASSAEYWMPPFATHPYPHAQDVTPQWMRTARNVHMVILRR